MYTVYAIIILDHRSKTGKLQLPRSFTRDEFIYLLNVEGEQINIQPGQLATMVTSAMVIALYRDLSWRSS